MRTIQREIVSGVIFSQDGKILFAKKRAGGSGVYADCWHIPGGGMEDGESREETLAREIREEVGIDIAGCPVELLDDTDTGVAEKTLKTGETVLAEMHFIDYRVKLPHPAADIRLTLGEEFDEYQWLLPTELGRITQTPPSVKLFTKLGYFSRD
ncbi:NUDIX domain-containing protein [Patescibacteria group bacterium]|nr:NUDIX domain-containing protein [Patescibacteria group bacterium]